MPTLEQAQYFLTRHGDLPPLNIFPLNGKIPFKKENQTDLGGFYMATMDPETIRKWWTFDHPAANIGIRTGQSNGLVVIDIDNHPDQDRDGEGTIRNLEAKYGPLPQTIEVLTGSGGRHLYFKYPAGHLVKTASDSAKDADGTPLKGLDWRGEGGYVVAPGSIHPVTKQEYQFEAAADPEDGTPLADLPAWLIELIEVKQTFTPAQPASGIPSERPADFYEQFKIPAVIDQGGRNAILTQYAGKLVRRHVPRSLIYDILMDTNKTRCKPPLDAEEIRQIVLHSSKWPDPEPVKEDPPQPSTKEVPADPAADGFMDLEAFDEEIVLAPELINSVLRQGHKMLVTGASKAGKTFLLIELAMAIATGQNWLGHKCTKGKVLYIDFEVDRPSILNRINIIGQAMGIPENANGYHFPQGFTLLSLRDELQYGFPTLSGLTDRICAHYKRGELSAIILDPIYMVLQGDENSNSDMRKFCLDGLRLVAKTDASFIYSHHHAKGAMGSRSALDRGSGAGVFARFPDAVIDMTALDIDPDMVKEMDINGGYNVTITARDFPPKKPFNIRFKYPLHELDAAGQLNEYHPTGSREANLARSPKRSLTPDKMFVDLTKGYTDVLKFSGDPEGWVSIASVAAAMKTTDRTVKNYINALPASFERNRSGKMRRKIVEPAKQLKPWEDLPTK